MKLSRYLNTNCLCRLENVCIFNTKILDRCAAAIQFQIAVIFEQGIGLKQNLTFALRWYHRAANNGHVGAQNSLGILYYAGLGAKQDFVLALIWFKKAAAMGNNYAQHSLVKM